MDGLPRRAASIFFMARSSLLMMAARVGLPEFVISDHWWFWSGMKYDQAFFQKSTEFAMVDGWILVVVGVLVAVHFDLEVPHDLLRRDCQQLGLAPLVPGRVIPAVVEEAHQLPHLVVVFLHLRFCLLELGGLAGPGRGRGRGGCRAGAGNSARHFCIFSIVL